jgi:hypothetical protein
MVYLLPSSQRAEIVRKRLGRWTILALLADRGWGVGAISDVRAIYSTSCSIYLQETSTEA